MKKIATQFVLALPAIMMALNTEVLAIESLPQRGPIPFHFYDADKSGAINAQEFDLIHMQRKAAQGRPASAISSQAKFRQFDTDNDGLLSLDELLKGQQMQKMQRQQMMQTGAAGIGVGRGRGRNMSLFTDFDRDKDGYISEQELIEARSMRISQRIQQGYQMRNTANITSFKDIDQNSDGKISAQEFSAQQQKHRMSKRP